MATIQLNTANSLEITGSESDPGATLNKYLHQPLTLFSQDHSLSTLASTTIKQIDHKHFPINFALKETGKFKVSKTAFNLKPSAAAVLDLLAGDKATDVQKLCDVPGAKDLASPAEFLSFAVTGSVEADPSEPVGDFSFGVSSGVDVTVTNYCRVTEDEVFLTAAKNVVSGLTIPHDIDDLKQIPVGNVCGVKGTGTLKFTVTLQHNFINNPLATVPLGSLPLSINVKAQSETTLDVSVKHTAGHELKIAALGNGKLRLAATLTTGDDLETGLEVSIGSSVNVMDQDVLTFLLQRISADPDKEIAKLKQDLPEGPDRQQLCGDVQKALETAINSSLKASLKESFDWDSERESLMQYEIDLNALDQTSSQALQLALRGDFSALTGSTGVLKGITPLDSAVTLTKKRTHTLTAHLIGIFNFADISSFVRKAKPAANKDTGEIVLTAEDIQIVDDNLDPEKLREVLVKSAMLTAAAAANTANYPDFTLKFVYFIHKANANRDDLRMAVNALGAVASADEPFAAGLMEKGDSHFGATTLYLSLDLDKDATRALFLSGAQPRKLDEYVRAACNAMQAILRDNPDAKNRMPLFTAGLPFWNQLRDAGSRDNVVRLLQQHRIQETAATDFYALDWWAGAMAHAADAIAQKQSVEKAASDVLKKSEGGFEEPWAVLSTYFILQPRVNVTSKFASTAAAKRPMRAVAGAASMPA